ncbi:MAG: MliC family protein [Rhodocyclaceae bacterium]|nr:MliC family protein [Rhodocyclaceae bacterium]
MRPALLFLLSLPAAAATGATTAACTPAWFDAVEARLPTRDGQGHGPDRGSDEWRSAIEFRLGVRGEPTVPPRASEAWCTWIAQRLDAMPEAPAAGGPAFDCALARGRVEETICREPDLASLDRQLSGVYRAALKKAANEHPPQLKATQRGWIKGRNDCWKADDLRQCIVDSYRQRILELQARYRLVPLTGPVFYRCDDAPDSELVVHYLATDPPSLIAERGDTTSLMVRQPSGSGARYQGGNESLWEHQGEATVQWGFGAEAMHCRVAR